MKIIRILKKIFISQYDEIKNSYIPEDIYTDTNILLTEDNFYVLLITQQISRDDCDKYIKSLPKNRHYELLLCLHIYDNYRNYYNENDLLELNTYDLRYKFYYERTLEKNF